MRRRQIAVFGVVALAIAAPAAAQAAKLVLSIEEAIERAAAHAPGIAEVRARRAVADANVSISRAATRPTVSVTSGLLRTNHVDEFGVPQPDGNFRVIFPDIPTNYRARGELAVPLYTSGRTAALVDVSEAERRAAAADVRAASADAVLQAATAYWGLVDARDRVAVRERALARADASVADVRARVDAGILPPNDLLSAQAQRARQSVQLIQARSAAASAEIRLALAIGAPVDQPIEAVSSVDRPAGDVDAIVSLPLGDLVARARDGRAERTVLAERRRALEHGADALSRALRPQVHAVAALEPARPNPRFVPRTNEWNTAWDLGVNLTWSLYDGGRSRSQRSATLAQASAMTHRLNDFDAALAVDVRERLLDLESTRAAVAAAAEGIEAATEARRVVGERFAVGVATSTEVLDAEVALLEAELERTTLLASLRLSEARLLRAVGAR